MWKLLSLQSLAIEIKIYKHDLFNEFSLLIDNQYSQEI